MAHTHDTRTLVYSAPVPASPVGRATYRDASGTIVTRRVYAILERTWVRDSEYASTTTLAVSHPDALSWVRETVADADYIDYEVFA